MGVSQVLSFQCFGGEIFIACIPLYLVQLSWFVIMFHFASQCFVSFCCWGPDVQKQYQKIDTQQHKRPKLVLHSIYEHLLLSTSFFNSLSHPRQEETHKERIKKIIMGFQGHLPKTDYECNFPEKYKRWCIMLRILFMAPFSWPSMMKRSLVLDGYERCHPL